MPDWRELVSKGLSDLKLGAGEKEEVHAELAEHLEETYKALRGGGLPEQAGSEERRVGKEGRNELRPYNYKKRNGKEIITDRMKELELLETLAFALSTGMLELR